MLGDTRDAGWSIRDDALVAYPFPDPEPNLTAGDGTIDRLAFFGRLERRKGLDIFLDALDELPEDIPALFIGRDTKMDGRWAKQIIEERLGERPYKIEDELNREAALARLAGGDSLAVIASRSETFGFTVAECIANEIPFIAADAGGIPEVVRDEEAQRRWLFEPSARNLALKIKERLAADPADEARLRRQAAERCDPTRWNDEVEAIYRGAVERFRQEIGGKAPDRDRQTVAVAVTHYNHADFLPAALASLAAQTRQPNEVFVIDDGSTDADAVAVFAEQESLYPQWTFLRQENAGPGAGRNRCLELSTSSCFLPFDSDNIARPELIEALVTALEIDPSRDVATCQNLAFVDDPDIAAEKFVFRFAPPGGPRLLSPLENLFGDTCGLFRSEVLRSVGGFEVDRQSPHEDWETLVKMAFAGFDIDVVPRPLFWYRTSVGGRLETLAGDPASNFRLRKRMVEAILADVELTRAERISLWEFLVAFALPNEEVAFLQRAHDEVAEWAHKALHDNNASHEKRHADTIAWYEELLVGASAGALNGASAKQLWVAAGRRTARGAARRAKALSIRGRERVKARLH
jgi:glycosyltransferase involved in cell wall biosynthesis